MSLLGAMKTCLDSTSRSHAPSQRQTGFQISQTTATTVSPDIMEAIETEVHN